ncbi:MAG TPA: caspase family protein [Bradyrhizobium sp.]|jgi:hypothetical protein|nr:caspase family protein [Bradyrhizobium sp.]
MAIRRRDVLAGSLAWAQFVASRNVLAQNAPAATRAAVVIGVNKTGNLPVLKAAVSGAKLVAEWLEEEKFDVKLIVDESGPVTAAAIKRVVFELVERNWLSRTLTQLVVYFSGHGMAFGSSEFWLLTGAPEDTSEAVSVVACCDLAHNCGIPNVIFISDACRSIPEYNASLIGGTPIFPNKVPIPGSEESAVDRFLAAEPGNPSFEVKEIAAAKYAGIYTAVFLDAFKRPRRDMVQDVGGHNVILNIKLKTFLKEEVPQRLGAVDLNHTQYPVARFESRDNNYIGHALGPVTDPVVTASNPAKTTVLDVASHRLNISTIGAIGSLITVDSQILTKVASESGFEAAQKNILEAQRPESFETQTGFSVNGARVKVAVAAWPSRAEILRSSITNPGTDGPALVRISQSARPVTVGLIFEDGSGTVLAALPGFIGTLTVEKGLVVSVTYLPSRNSPRWSEYGADSERLDRLRSVVATSARYGAFRIDGNKDERTEAARRIGDQIRVLKGIDPTLGIYAAYAYADANLTEQVRSVRSFMQGDLGADLFDVALLANALSGKRIDGLSNVVPFCPMLTQGWQLLRVKEVSLLESVERARGDLRDSLWTTIGPRGMDLMLGVIQSLGRTNAG